MINSLKTTFSVQAKSLQQKLRTEFEEVDKKMKNELFFNEDLQNQDPKNCLKKRKKSFMLFKPGKSKKSILQSVFNLTIPLLILEKPTNIKLKANKVHFFEFYPPTQLVEKVLVSFLIRYCFTNL